MVVNLIWLMVASTILVVLFKCSTTANYTIKMTLYYFCILIHGILCTVILIPSYLREEGADNIFKYFTLWTFWIKVSIQTRGHKQHLENLKGPAIVVVNHQSSLDMLAMHHVWPKNGVGMIKRSLMWVPFFNVAAFLSRSVYVDRYNHKSAMASLDQCIDEVKRFNRKVWIFVEGTRNQNGSLLPFKKGAFNIAVRAQIPIVPIVLSDYRPFYLKGERIFRDGGLVIAEVLPPVSTENLTKDDVNSLSDTVRKQMLEVFQKNSEEARKLMVNTLH